MKTITTKFLESHNACKAGMVWVTKNKLIGMPAIDFLNKLIEADKLDWANWLIVRVMNKKQKVQYAIFAAEQVIDIYEKKYPTDDRPRKAIEAAKEYLAHPSVKNKTAAKTADAAATAYAATATYAADAAAVYAADAAAAYAAAYAAAAYAAAYAAATAYTAYTAAYAATYAAAYAAAAYAATADAAAAADVKTQMRLTILNYGLTLIKP